MSIVANPVEIANPLTVADAIDIARELALRFLAEPDEIESVAREYGVWDELCALVDEPLHLEHARRDPNVFIEFATRDTNGDPIRQADFHIEWQRMMGELEATLIMAPRGHAKSMSATSRLVWEIGNNPRLRIKIVCAKDAKAQELLLLVYKQITENPLVQAVFPNLRIDVTMPDKADMFCVVRPELARDATVQASGVFSAGAGGRADILLCDDVCDEVNSNATATRVKVINTVRNVWFALLAPRSRIWWLCTPYHIDDATHTFQRQNPPVFAREWRKPAITYRLTFDASGAPIVDEVTGGSKQEEVILWPEWWSKAALDAQYAILGALAFARQYQLKVQHDEDLTFRKDLVLSPSYDRTLWKIGQALPLDGRDGDIPDTWPTFGGIDLAAALSDPSKQSKRAAFFVVWTLAYCPENGRLYLKDMARKKGDFHEIIGEIVRAYGRHKWEFAYVENNAFQKAVETFLQREHVHIPIEGWFTGNNKNDLTVGLKGMAATMSKGAFVIPARDVDTIAEDDPSDFGIFWNEITGHPGARYSDTVMALWLAWQAFRKGFDPVLQDYAAYVSAS